MEEEKTRVISPDDDAVKSAKIVKSADTEQRKPMTSPESESQSQMKVYKSRWVVLVIFIIYSLGSTYQWIQYSIIANIITKYYGVSALAVDVTSMSYMACYTVAVVPATYLMDKIGLRWTTILGSGLTCLGSCIKLFSVDRDSFYVTYLGQSLPALCQTFVLTTPGRLASMWFGSRQLSTATSLGLVGSQLGIALGFFLTPMIVRNHENMDDIGRDLSNLYWAVAIYTAIPFLLTLLFFKEEPRLPPSQTRILQKASHTENREEGFLPPLKRLLSNKCFLILCNSYGLNIGVLNAVSTLLNQMFLLHFENGEEAAGRIGLAIIITGMLGSVTFGAILDKTHKFKETTVAVCFLTLCGQILFSTAMYAEIKWMVYLSSIFLGFFLSGYLALGYEMCAEYTYPESESVTTGILNIANNLYGIVMVIVLGKLLESYGDLPVHISLCVALLLGFILTVCTKDEQRRQDARREAKYQAVKSTDKELPPTV